MSNVSRPFDRHEQFAGLCVIGYLEALLTASPKQSFSRDELLILLNDVKTDPDLFALEVVIAYQAERNEWAAGRRRVEAGQVQVWHAPLKPGDAGWWEKP